MIDRQEDVVEILPKLYLPFAAYVNQTRALPDARDFLKTGTRYLLYAQYKNKLTYKNKRQKATATVSATMRYNPHGDASIYGTAIRLAQPFSMRYPLEDIQGSAGTYVHGDDFAASRYVEMRSNEIADYMTRLLEKDVIGKWFDSYDGTSSSPEYLPSLFPQFVNGSFGIGVGMSSSCPQYNLVEICDSVVKLYNNADIAFDDIYCAPDFCTGGIIINGDAVKESIRKGKGSAIILRAKIDYDEAVNELIISEIPYMTHTGNLIKEIQTILQEGKLIGVNEAFDGTDANPKICLKLNSKANIKQIIKTLYKETNLQSSYGVNVMLLKNGLVPAVFGFKDILQTYINTTVNIMRKGFEFDLTKAQLRLEIVNGYLIALADIDEVVNIIKTSQTTDEASKRLKDKFALSDRQIKAILELKLQSLIHMEAIKLENEQKNLIAEIDKLSNILENKVAFDGEFYNLIRELKTKFGDCRRTVIKNNIVETEDDKPETTDEIVLNVAYTNKQILYCQIENDSKKVFVGRNEFIVKFVRLEFNSPLYILTNAGNYYIIEYKELNGKIDLYKKLNISPSEKIIDIVPKIVLEQNQFYIAVTKNGIVKKSLSTSILSKRGKNQFIILSDNDTVIDFLVYENGQIGIATKNGNILIVNTEDFIAMSKLTRGCIGITLNKNDEVVAAKIMFNPNKIISISRHGKIKQTNFEEFSINAKSAKGSILQQLDDNDGIADFVPIVIGDTSVQVQMDSGIAPIKLIDVPLQGRNTKGKNLSKIDFVLSVEKN
jgi:DNA gyrase subunit A